jgi:putative ABC transport system substrate-binding protein
MEPPAASYVPTVRSPIGEHSTFISGITLGLLVAPRAAQAQPSRKMHRIGLLLTSPDGETGFIAALRDLGYVEGQNISIERRYMADRKEGLSVLATELVRLNPDIIVVVNGYQAAAVRESTTTVPIVTIAAGDLVAEGLVANLAKPGGNVTGSQVMQPDTAAKRIALLKDTIPSISRVALLFGLVGQWFYDNVSRETRAAAETLRLTVQVFQVRTPAQLDDSFASMQKERIQAALVTGDQFTFFHRRRVANLAMQYRLPTMCDARLWVDAGNVMSYGADVLVLIERAALFVDKILKGATPSDLPVEQPTKFELAINLKAAKALGLTIPPSLLQRADQVIE